jgi:hypothetical protein
MTRNHKVKLVIDKKEKVKQQKRWCGAEGRMLWSVGATDPHPTGRGETLLHASMAPSDLSPWNVNVKLK